MASGGPRRIVKEQAAWRRVAPLLLAVEAAELTAAVMLPPPLSYAFPAAIMPFTACQFLSDGWVRRRLLSVMERSDKQAGDGPSSAGDERRKGL